MSHYFFYLLGDQYALKMRLVDHVYDDQVIDSLTVKIILPEGARSVLTNLCELETTFLKYSCS